MIKKGDILIIASLLLSAVLLAVGIFLSEQKSVNADTVTITVNGETYKTVSLQADEIITVKNGDDLNVITIKNGEVYMSEASCKNGDCIKCGHISRAGESIICLPNRVAVTISGNNGEYDAVAR